MNLVPTQPGRTPSHWSTWSEQVGFAPNGPDDTSAAAALTEAHVFKNPGWIRFYPQARRDLYFLFDLGWDVPKGVNPDEMWHLGSMEVAADKFRSCTGTPAQRLRKLNEMTKAAGWRGAAVWVPAQTYGDGRNGRMRSDKETEDFWRERARWAREAGIEYWKVDYGVRDTFAFRKLVTRIAREEAPGLLVEHSTPMGPVNDLPDPEIKVVAHRTGRFRAWDDGRILQRAVELLDFCDVLRTYDITAQLAVASTLDRAAQILADASKRSGSPGGLLTCDSPSPPFLAGGLGVALALATTPRLTEPKADEVVRAVRWQRLSPALGVREVSVTVDTNILTDTWAFKEGESWAKWLVGHQVMQGAPARVARGMALPQVVAEGPPPFVVATRYPNGCVAVATLPRTSAEKGVATPPAAVALEVGEGAGAVGVFGRYRTLMMKLSAPLGARRIWAQDLAGDVAIDVTEQIQTRNRTLTLTGELITQVGLSAASAHDTSDPALVLVLKKP